MKTTKIIIRNLFGIKECDLDGKSVELSGPKGSGKRAWSSSGRNELWQRTANKYGWYVEIVENNLQDWYAFELERDLISFYGRRC